MSAPAIPPRIAARARETCEKVAGFATALHGGILCKCAEIAAALLAQERETREACAKIADDHHKVFHKVGCQACVIAPAIRAAAEKEEK